MDRLETVFHLKYHGGARAEATASITHFVPDPSQKDREYLDLYVKTCRGLLEDIATRADQAKPGQVGDSIKKMMHTAPKVTLCHAWENFSDGERRDMVKQHTDAVLQHLVDFVGNVVSKWEVDEGRNPYDTKITGVALQVKQQFMKEYRSKKKLQEAALQVGLHVPLDMKRDEMCERFARFVVQRGLVECA